MYAGFWKRLAALIIDGTLTNALMFVVMMAAGYDISGQTEPGIRQILIILFASLAIFILYWPLFESSPLQATPGKMALGIKVADMHGGRVSFGKAFGRNLGKIISSCTLNIGYAMAGFTVRKQALHDKMAGCLVIDKNAAPEELLPLAPAKTWFVCLAILGTLMPYIITFLLTAALAVFFMKNYMPSAGAEGFTVDNGVAYAQESRAKIAKSIGALLSLISHFQNVYAERNGHYAASFAELEEGIPGFPEQPASSEYYKIDLGEFYVKASYGAVPGEAAYIITRCYKSDKTCIYSEDYKIAGETGFVYSAPEDCCLEN